MEKTTTKQFYKYYNKWVRPFVVDKGDNLLESEGQLYTLINSILDKCATKIEKETYTENRDEDALVEHIVNEIRKFK